jgi:phosphoglycolate phosphatase-like HAD superfamily hydrolase
VSQRLVLFDVDGTLLLSGGAGRRAILKALTEETGVSGERAAHVRFDGKTDPAIVVELFAAAGLEPPPDELRIGRLLDRYLTHLEADLAVNAHLARLMPGIIELLEVLDVDDRVVVGLLTGNVSRGAAIKLRAVGLAPERFRVGAYGSDRAVRDELPPIAAERAIPHFGRRPIADEIVIIGDTPADVACGRAVGARTVAVATGGFSRAELFDCGADDVFDDLRDTERVRSSILGWP